MRNETMLAARLRSVGITPQITEIRLTLAKWHNNNVSYETVRRELDAAYGREASVASVLPKGPNNDANASPQNAAKGQEPYTDKVRPGLPSAAPKIPVTAHLRSRASRLAAGTDAVEEVYKKSLFDTYRMFGDDRPIGDITWKELPGIARKSAEAAKLASLIAGYAHADPDARVRDVLKESALKKFIEMARQSNAN